MARAALAFVVLLVLAGCGGADGDAGRFELTTPRDPESAAAEASPAARRPASRAEVRIIRGWSDALRHGDVDRAVRYFRVPARVSNGGAPVELKTRVAVRFFNETLPCGARLKSAERVENGFVLATFRLTERPGRGRCGTGTGQLARTLFYLEHGRIVQWLRAIDPPPDESGSTS